jgi:hypothetical protein
MSCAMKVCGFEGRNSRLLYESAVSSGRDSSYRVPPGMTTVSRDIRLYSVRNRRGERAHRRNDARRRQFLQRPALQCATAQTDGGADCRGYAGDSDGDVDHGSGIRRRIRREAPRASLAEARRRTQMLRDSRPQSKAVRSSSSASGRGGATAIIVSGGVARASFFKAWTVLVGQLIRASKHPTFGRNR